MTFFTKLSRPVLTAITLLALAQISVAEKSANSESVIDLGHGVTATERPSSVGSEHACVLLIHGWTSTMDEVGELYKRLAQQLAQIGIASLRIQIPGESRALGNRLTGTFAERVSAASLGLNYLTKNCAKQKIGVVGFSLGGATAMALAGKYPDNIHSLVLWSSATDPSQVEQRLLTPTQIGAIMTDGEVAIETYQTFIFTRRHLLGLRGHEQILERLANYSKPLLSLRGSEDFLQQRDLQIIKAAGSELAEHRIIKGADHIFNTLDPTANLDTALLKHSKDWLWGTLVEHDY